MRARSDNTASAPYRRIRAKLDAPQVDAYVLFRQIQKPKKVYVPKAEEAKPTQITVSVN